MSMKYLKKMMKTNTGKILLVTTIIAIAIICSMLFHNKTPEVIDKTDTVYKTRVDTIKAIKDTTIYKTVPKYIEILKTDTLYTKDGKDTVLSVENKTYQDTLTCANDTIILQSFITGVKSQRDSIKANWKRRETIITNTIEITKYVTPKKTFKDHFKVGPSVTAGYDMINRNWGVMAGLSFNVTF